MTQPSHARTSPPAVSPGGAGAIAPGPHHGGTIRSLHTKAEFEACVDLQREVWGFERAEVVPATLLHVVEYVGGLAAGAFDAHDQLLGFVFGISGVRDGELVHWSHMLAVRETERNAGLGRTLKEYQRTVMAGLGIQRIFWSFDPLMVKNAHLNINRLGAHAVDYVPDMYGSTSSPLHLGLPTDRLIVAIETRPAGDAKVEPDEDASLPVLTIFPRRGDTTISIGAVCPDTVLIEVPPDMVDLTQRSVAKARTWRLAVRDHFLWAFASGYDVDSVRRSGDRAFYVMVKRRTT